MRGGGVERQFYCHGIGLYMALYIGAYHPIDSEEGGQPADRWENKDAPEERKQKREECPWQRREA